jgi:hypothetical protein
MAQKSQGSVRAHAIARALSPFFEARDVLEWKNQNECPHSQALQTGLKRLYKSSELNVGPMSSKSLTRRTFRKPTINVALSQRNKFRARKLLLRGLG